LLPPDLNLEVDRVVEQPVIIEEHEVNMTPPPPDVYVKDSDTSPKCTEVVKRGRSKLAVK
jgi:hypothetical protein